MQMLIGFAPFILFAALTHISSTLGLWLAFAAAFAIGIRTFLMRRELRSLDIGNVVLFGLLALYVGFIAPGLSIALLRLIVHGGLLAVILYSLIVKQPFTLPYAREQTPQAMWTAPHFLLTSRWISTGWAVAFALMAAGDVAVLAGLIRLPVDIAIGLIALIGAVIFSLRAPLLLRKKFGLPG